MEVIIYGGGKLGLYMLSLLSDEHFSHLKVLGFVDDQLPKSNNHCSSGLNLFGTLKQYENNPESTSDDIFCVLAIGYNDLKARIGAFTDAKRMGIQFVTIVHPSAILLPGSDVAEGSYIGPGAILDVNTKIGAANFIDAGCVLSEEVIVGVGNYLSPKVVICGHTRIGMANFFGAASCVRNGLSIGDCNFLNMQTLLIRNLENGVMVSEARKITYLE